MAHLATLKKKFFINQNQKIDGFVLYADFFMRTRIVAQKLQ